MLESISESVKICEQKVKDLEKSVGADHPGVIKMREFAQEGRKEYEAYKAATAESRAYKSQAQASQSEETKGDADANASVDGASTERKTKKTSDADAKK